MILKLKALNPIKTADLLITLTWEAINDETTSEETLKILVCYLQLINDNNNVKDF